MNFKFKNKKNLIFIIIFVFLIIIGGFFWWQRNQWDIYKYSRPNSFVIKDIPAGKIVENSMAGLAIEVLDGWRVEVGNIGGEEIVDFFCPETELYPNGGLKEGCLVEIEVLDCSEKDSIARVDLNETKKIINIFPGDPEKLSKMGYRIQEVSGFKALEEIVIKEVAGREVSYISVKVPIELRLYHFNALLVPDNERNRSDFDKFLEKISIK